jgi:hypothetical protein
MEGIHVIYLNRARGEFLYFRTDTSRRIVDPSISTGGRRPNRFFLWSYCWRVRGIYQFATNGTAGQANKVRRYTFLIAIAIVIILMLIPDALGHLVGLGMEVASFTIFPRIQDVSFAEWQGSNSGVEPSNGWKAIGWGFLGLLLFVLLAVVIGMAMALMGIPIP